MTPPQCRAARALLDWTQLGLASASRLSLSTIVDFEKQRRKTISEDAKAAIRTALETAGVEFINGTGVKLRT
nr:helix-turn-helix domain-containing protein [Mesorhizobium comanense]